MDPQAIIIIIMQPTYIIIIIIADSHLRHRPPKFWPEPVGLYGEEGPIYLPR